MNRTDIIADRLANVPFAEIRKVAERATQLEAQGKKVIHFEIGRPDFDTPAHIKAAAVDALDRGDILIFFPEGTRGEPERLKELKSGIARLQERRPEVPVVPIFMHGLGKALPKGEAILVPFFVDVFVGEPVTWTGDRDSYLGQYRHSIEVLAEEGEFPEWK